jgi:HNH endonuclease
MSEPESSLPHWKIRLARLAEARAKGTHTEGEWQELKAKWNHRCLACWEMRPLTKDHVIRVADDGSDRIDNIQPLCRSCNSMNGGVDVDFRPLRASMDGWIAVETRMPDLNSRVLVLQENEKIAVASRVATWWSSDSEAWRLRRCPWTYIPLRSVLFWRELP